MAVLTSIKSSFRLHKGLLKRLLPIACLITYSIGGGAIFYYAETRIGPVHLHGREEEFCLSKYDYWGSLYFAGCLYTSIGYGSIFPCSRVGRLITMVYTLGGLPLYVYVVDGVGLMLLDLLAIGWRNWKKLKEKLKGNSQTQSEKYDKMAPKVTDVVDDDDMPIYLGFLLAFIWLCLCAAYFSVMEKWPFLEAFYFTFISATSIGLGDFAATSSYSHCPAHFAMVTVALAMVSLTIKIFQKQLDRFIELTKKRIFDNYKKRMEMETVQDTHDIWKDAKSQAGLMRFLISDKVRGEIQEKIEQRNRQINVHTDTSEVLVHRQIQAIAEMFESFTEMDLETAETHSEALLDDFTSPVETQTELDTVEGESENQPDEEWLIASDKSDLELDYELNSYQKLRRKLKNKLKKVAKANNVASVEKSTPKSSAKSSKSSAKSSKSSASKKITPRLMDSRLEAILVLTDDPLMDYIKPTDNHNPPK